MLCRKPFVRGMDAYGCGQCMPCRLNRRRIWSHRIMLESLVHSRASFLTLTYDPENVPDGGSLAPRDLQLWLKRFRKTVGPARFFAVGEYGDLSWRPHYHVALFGWGPEAGAMVSKTWGLGFTYAGELTLDSAQYIAGYVTKKMTAKDDPRLNGLYPEFARMSNRPGIGAVAIPDLAAALQNKAGWDEIERIGDVPTALRHGKSILPLGRYMRRKLRIAMNFKEDGESDETAYKRSAEVLVMYQNYLLTSPSPLGLKDMIVSEGSQKALQIEKRAKIYSGGKKL